MILVYTCEIIQMAVKLLKSRRLIINVIIIIVVDKTCCAKSDGTKLRLTHKPLDDRSWQRSVSAHRFFPFRQSSCHASSAQRAEVLPADVHTSLLIRGQACRLFYYWGLVFSPNPSTQWKQINPLANNCWNGTWRHFDLAFSIEGVTD